MNCASLVCEPRGFQHLAAHQPIEAADAAAGRAQSLAFEVGRGLDAFGHHVSLRQARRQAPNLLHPDAAADFHRIGRDQRGALRGRGARRRRFTAVELDDAGVDAMLGEVAELQRHIRRGVNHVRRRDGNADIDPAHRGAIGLRRRLARTERKQHTKGGEALLRGRHCHPCLPCRALASWHRAVSRRTRRTKCRRIIVVYPGAKRTDPSCRFAYSPLLPWFSYWPRRPTRKPSTAKTCRRAWPRRPTAHSRSASPSRSATSN